MKKQYISEMAWSKVFNFLKEQEKIYIKEEKCCKSFIEAIYWMTRTGAQWRELPDIYGKWNSVFSRFNNWAKKNIWDALLTFCSDDPDLESVMIDATIVRAHACSAGYNIANILDMTVNDAIAAFREEKKIFAILDLMRQVDLGHLKLGQSTATLSGGEAQRIKLAAELSKSEMGNTLYLLDEPTTGLHPNEVGKLLTIFRKLISKGNMVVVIEHNLDVICDADTIIDFGPGGGIVGGKIVATGTPQEIMENQDSLTGKSLRAYIENDLDNKGKL